jgi:hypothetical protein
MSDRCDACQRSMSNGISKSDRKRYKIIEMRAKWSSIVSSDADAITTFHFCIIDLDLSRLDDPKAGSY